MERCDVENTFFPSRLTSAHANAHRKQSERFAVNVIDIEGPFREYPSVRHSTSILTSGWLRSIRFDLIGAAPLKDYGNHSVPREFCSTIKPLEATVLIEKRNLRLVMLAEIFSFISFPREIAIAIIIIIVGIAVAVVVGVVRSDNRGSYLFV